MAAITRKKDTLMTEGAIWKNILLFALPLMLGNIFQQLYNTVDSIVVGNFVGKEALAAVGTTDSIINTFIGFFSGLATGSGIIISQYFGEKNEKGVHDAVHTTIALTFLMSLICTACAILLVPAFLHMMGTPKDVFEQSAVYLRIYFAGSMGLLFYNMGAGILRAVGDSRRPLYFLIFSALLNIVLDLFFVAYLGLGVAGVAWATIISQGASAILIMAALSRETESYRVIWREVRINPVMTRKIFQIGLPSALQMAVTSFSNVFVQSYINHFGSAAMAGWSSYGKIDKFCLLPIQSISMGVTTFVGQNLGAGKIRRIRQGMKSGLLLAMLTSAVIAAVMLVFGQAILGCFITGTPEEAARTMEIAYHYLAIMSVCLPILYLLHVVRSSIQGMGDTVLPMLSGVVEFLMRTGAALFLPLAMGQEGIFYAEILAWIGADVVLVVSYFVRIKGLKGGDESGD